MKLLSNSFKGSFGEKFVSDFLTKKGYIVTVSPNNGSDLIAKKGRKSFCVEVKTSGNLKGGIPDMHTTEFYQKRGKWFFVADYLYIVRINAKGKPVRLDIVGREEIDRYAGSHRTVTRVRTTKLDKDLFHEKIGQSVKL